MKAAVVTGSFGRANVRVADVDTPRPGHGQLLLKVRATSLNYRDLLVADGSYNPSYPLPLILGSDAVGEVIAFGEDADGHGVELGDRVCPIFAQGWFDGAPGRRVTQLTLGGPLPGVFAEYAVARADSVVRVPDYLDDVEAATLPCAAVTAWSALATLSPVRAGELVLTLGSGGVSLFALAIARRLGARVFATSRDPAKHERLRALGAEQVLDARDTDWGRLAQKLAGGEGMHHVVDVGGGDTLAQSLRAVRPGGTVSLIGVLGGKETQLNLLPIVMRNIRVQGVFVGHKLSFEAMLREFAAAELRPSIDSVFDLHEIQVALERLGSGKHFGKICLRL